MTADANEKTPVKKGNPLLKWLLRIVAGLFILLVVAFLLYYFMVDGFIRSKIIEAGKNATGQDTKLEIADLRAFSGTLTLNKFNLANPKDFSSGGVCDFGSCFVSVDTGSLMTDTVVIKEIKFTDFVVSIEQKDLRNNLQEIINYIQKQRGEPTAGEAAPPQASANPNAGKGKSLKVEVIHIVRPKMKFDILGVKSSFDLDDIEFKQPLDEQGRNDKLIDLFANILMQMANQSLKNPKIPADIQKLMNNSLGQLSKEIDKEVGKFTKGLDKEIHDIQKNLTLPGNIKGPDIKIPEFKNPFEQKK